MSFDASLIFFISMLLMWIKPGPAQLLKIATTLEKGLLSGISFSLGSIVMCSLFFIVAALGYKALSDIFSYTGFLLQIFGAVYLTYLSIKGFIKLYSEQIPRLNPTEQVVNKKTGILGGFTLGFVAAMTSPFWIFYFIGILPSLIPLSGLTPSDFLLGAFLVLLSGVMVDWPMLTLVRQLQKEFVSGKWIKYVSVFINFSFLVIAGFLLYSAFFVQKVAFDINEVL